MNSTAYGLVVLRSGSKLGECVEIFTPTFDDSKRVYMHVHDGPIQVWVNDHLVYESPKEPSKEEKLAEEFYKKLEVL